MAYCPNCDHEISATASTCPKCNADFTTEGGWKPVQDPQKEKPKLRQASGPNPHVFWRQLLVVCLFSIVGFVVGGLGGILQVTVGLCIFGDAWVSGIWKQQGKKSFLNIGPAAWGVCSMLIPILVLPLYFLNRNKLKTREDTDAFWYIALAICIFSIAVFLFMIGAVFQGWLRRL